LFYTIVSLNSINLFHHARCQDLNSSFHNKTSRTSSWLKISAAFETSQPVTIRATDAVFSEADDYVWCYAHNGAVHTRGDGDKYIIILSKI